MPFIIPAIVLVFSFLLKIASGPYWQFPDPCYGNLIASLSLLKGLSPHYISSPGTPLQLMGAAIIFLLNFGHSTAEMVRQALLSPEIYLNAINISELLLVFLTSSMLGAYVWRQTQDKLAVFLSQLPVLSYLSLRSFSCYTWVLPIVTNVTPEVLMISVSSLFDLFLLKLYYAKDGQEETRLGVWLGFICGLGMACKLTFAFFLVLPLIVLKGGRRKLLFLAVSAAFLFLWTIPIIPSYGRIAQWVISLSTHQGAYGFGPVGMLPLPKYLTNWGYISSRCAWLILFGLAAFYVGRKAPFVLATAFCILFQFALVAKHFDDHYLVPVINLFGALFVLAYLNVQNKSALFRNIVAVCIAVFVVFSLVRAVSYYKWLSDYTRDAVGLSDRLHAQYPGAVFVGMFPNPVVVPEDAFFLANDWDNSEADELASMYPHNFAYFYNNLNTYAPYDTGIYSIRERVWADDLLDLGAHVIFVGTKDDHDLFQAPYALVPLQESKYAAAYLLTGSTEKEANELLEASSRLSAAGDYAHAFAFALKARELHYQPLEKAQYFLLYLYHMQHP